MGLFSIWLQSFQEKRQKNYLMRKKGVKRTLSERSNKYFIQVTKKKKKLSIQMMRKKWSTILLSPGKMAR